MCAEFGLEVEGMKTKRHDAILDAALTAFATKGFDGTGLREIARLAGVAQPTIHYHFETKEKLFEEVVRRGAEHSVRLRLDRLEAVRAQSDPVALEAIVAALFHVYNVPPEGATKADYEFNQFVIRFGFADSQYARDVAVAPFNEMATHFIDAMLKTSDGFDRLTATRAYLWSLPTGMTAIMQHSRFARLANLKPDDPKGNFSFDALVDFICAGMRALASERKAPRGRRNGGRRKTT